MAKRYSEEIKQQAQHLFEANITLVKISEQLHVPVQTIRRWLDPDKVARDRLRVKEYYNKNKKAILAYQKEYTQQNKELIKERRALYYVNNKEACLKRSSDHRIGNKDRYNEASRRYRQRNKDKVNARTANRRTKKAKAPQACSVIEKMMLRNRYQEAKYLTEKTGVLHVVDHIWPISKGGPHLPWNTQILTATDNIRKSDHIGDDWK